MSYDIDDPIFKGFLGGPTCPRCRAAGDYCKILIKEYAFHRYYCPVCDKEEYESKLKEAKLKREEFYKNKRE